MELVDVCDVLAFRKQLERTYVGLQPCVEKKWILNDLLIGQSLILDIVFLFPKSVQTESRRLERIKLNIAFASLVKLLHQVLGNIVHHDSNVDELAVQVSHYQVESIFSDEGNGVHEVDVHRSTLTVLDSRVIWVVWLAASTLYARNDLSWATDWGLTEFHQSHLTARVWRAGWRQTQVVDPKMCTENSISLGVLLHELFPLLD